MYVTKRYRVQSPNVGRHGVIDAATLRKYTRVSADDMETAWDEAVAAMPEYDVRDTYMVTGALLPIWDRLSDANIKFNGSRWTAVSGTWGGSSTRRRLTSCSVSSGRAARPRS